MNQLTRGVDRQAGRYTSQVRDTSRGNIAQAQKLNQANQTTMLGAAANSILQGRMTNEQMRMDSLGKSSARNQFNVQARMKADDMNAANKAAYQNQMMTYGMGMFQNAGDIGNFITKQNVINNSGGQYGIDGSYKGFGDE